MSVGLYVNGCLTVVLVAIIAYQGLQKRGREGEDDVFQYITSPLTSPSHETEASRKLVAYTRNEFLNREILNVTDNVYVAIGFALANSIMIEGDDGLIIVDTTEDPESMKEIMREFRKISNKPVKAIIITHFHGDHVLGTEHIIQEERKIFPDQKTDIYAHELTKELMEGHSQVYDVAFIRGVRQFGTRVPRDRNSHTGSGLGPELKMSDTPMFYIPLPSVTFQDRASYSVAGVTFELLHTPGETDDQITVWLPREDVVMPADNIYKTFPNLYAIRGSPTRDCRQWYRSIDRTRNLGAKYMVPSHTRPVIGAAEVANTLLIYRDAIKYVHDQTVRLLNKGYLPDSIVKEVALPRNVASHPYLQEHYGTVQWSVRGVFAHYLGWFSGDPVDLEPLDSRERGTNLIELVTQARGKGISGVEIILQDAQKSLVNSHRKYSLTGKHIRTEDNWALQLANTVLENSDDGSQFANVAKQIKISALTSLGVESISANGRSYYLTSAIETEENWRIHLSKDSRAFVLRTSSVRSVLEMLCLKVAGLKCENKNYTIVLEFSDLAEKLSLVLRNSVCDVIDDEHMGSKPFVSASMTSQIWRELLIGEKNLESESKDGAVKFTEGSTSKLETFMQCFDPMI